MATRQDPSLSNLDQLVTCPLCDKTYTHPVNLIRCSHVYCKPCILERFGDKDLIACPMVNCGKKCKKSQLKPDERTEQLMKLFEARIDEKSRMDTTELRCELCNSKIAKWACYDCRQYLCGGPCAKTHRTMKALQDHTLTSIADIKQEKLSALRKIKEKLDPAEMICLRKYATLQNYVKSVTQTQNYNIDNVKQSEEMWVEQMRKIHSEIIRDIEERTSHLLASVKSKQERVSRVQKSISQEIRKYETMINNNNTCDLLNDQMYNRLIEKGQLYDQELESIKSFELTNTIPTFQCMQTENRNTVLDYASKALRDQIMETNCESQHGTSKLSGRRRPVLKHKSDDSPNLCSLKSLAKDKNLVVQNLHKFRRECSPKRIKCIDNELYVILKGGKICVLTIMDTTVTSRDITVHRNHRHQSSSTKLERVEYYVQSIANVKSGVIVAIGRPMNPSGTVSTCKSVGLAVVDTEGKVQIEITKGSYLDVVSDSGVVYGLTNPDTSHDERQFVHVFNHHRHTWNRTKTIDLSEKATRFVVAHAKHLYTSCSSDVVCKYDLELGTRVDQIQLIKRPKTAAASSANLHGFDFRQPGDTAKTTTHNAMVCFTDPQGLIFAVDYIGNSLQYITTRSQFRDFNPGLDFQGPWDSAMDDDGHIWLIASVDNSFALYRICSASNTY